MIKDQKFRKRRAASFQNPESTIQNLESSDAVDGYRGERVEIRALRFSEQRNAALNEQRTMSDENLGVLLQYWQC